VDLVHFCFLTGETGDFVKTTPKLKTKSVWKQILRLRQGNCKWRLLLVTFWWSTYWIRQQFTLWIYNQSWPALLTH